MRGVIFHRGRFCWLPRAVGLHHRRRRGSAARRLVSFVTSQRLCCWGAGCAVQVSCGSGWLRLGRRSARALICVFVPEGWWVRMSLSTAATTPSCTASWTRAVAGERGTSRRWRHSTKEYGDMDIPAKMDRCCYCRVDKTWSSDEERLVLHLATQAPTKTGRSSAPSSSSVRSGSSDGRRKGGQERVLEGKHTSLLGSECGLRSRRGHAPIGR